MNWSMELAQRLQQRRDDRLFRERITVESAQSACVTLQGRTFVNFCSNDYLGLASDRRLVTAFKAAADQYGVGSGASHLITGHCVPHQALEEALADFVNAPRALVFSTGYMANLGVANALLGRSDLVLQDRLNHASLIDAGLLCRAELRRYAHCDTPSVKRLLHDANSAHKLILTDAVFSMDGDLAPVPELVALSREYDARIVLDDAHGLGVLGSRGRGALEHFSQPLTPPIILMGTLGKALGTFGAFVAGEAALVETLIQRARTYIYTTAPPPAVAAATLEALRVVDAEPWRRQRLRDLVQRFRRGADQLGLPVMNSLTPIQPIVCGSAERTLAISDALKRAGVLVTAIRPPTVPKNTARLRVTFSAAHTENDVDKLLDALVDVFPIGAHA